MPQKGLGKRGGVPSSPFRLRRDKLRRGKRTFPKKGFFPSSSNDLLLGTEQKARKMKKSLKVDLHFSGSGVY